MIRNDEGFTRESTFAVPLTLLDDRVFPPLGLLQVAAILEQAGHHVQVADLAGSEDPLFGIQPYLSWGWDVYGLTATTPQFPTAVALLQRIRQYQPEKRVLIGGPHATVMPESCLMFDCVVRGDGEKAILRAVENDAPKEIDETSGMQKGLAQWVWPARHLIDLNSYQYSLRGLKGTSMMLSQGCPFGCLFCCGRTNPYYRRVRARAVDDVVAEMEHLADRYGIRAVMAFDDEVNILNEPLLEFCKKIKPLGMKFRAFVKANLFTDQQAEAMAEAGFVDCCTGVECLPEGEVVFTERGPKPIEEIGIGEMVLGSDFSGIKQARVIDKHYGEKSEYLVVTTDNSVLRCSTGHRLFTLGHSGIEELRAEHLRVGSWIATVGKLSVTGSLVYPPKEWRFIGYAVGDGCVSESHALRISDETLENLIQYKDLANTCGFGLGTIRAVGNTYVLSFSTVSRATKSAMENGVNILQPDRRIPEGIYTATDEEVSQFLAGIFDAEGQVDKDGRVVFSSSSELLAYGVKYLLLRLGITTGNLKDCHKEIDGEWFTWWRFQIRSKESLLKFASVVGFWHPNRNKRLEQSIYGFKERSVSRRSRSRTTVLPVTPKFVAEWLHENGTSVSTLWRKYRVSLGAFIQRGESVNALSKEFCQRVLDVAPVGPRADLIRRLLNDEIAWRRVRRVDKVELTVPVYDLTTTTQNYIANGILVHNSGDDRILGVIQKQTTREINKKYVDLVRKHGMRSKAFTSLGHPGETRESAQNLKDWLLWARPDDFDVTVITVYPGTPLWEERQILPEMSHGHRVCQYVRKSKVPQENGATLYFEEINYATEFAFYKGRPKEYVSHVWTPDLSKTDLVALRDEIEDDVRVQLGIPYPKRFSGDHLSGAENLDHSMGAGINTQDSRVQLRVPEVL